MSDLDPAAIDLSLRTPVGETLLGRHCNQLVCPVIQRSVVSDERKQSRADRQPTSKGRRMSQPPSLRDVGAPQRQRLVGEAEAEKGIPQIRLCKYVRVNSGMTDSGHTRAAAAVWRCDGDKRERPCRIAGWLRSEL